MVEDTGAKMMPPYTEKDEAREIAVELLQTALNLLKRSKPYPWGELPAMPKPEPMEDA